MFQLTSPLERHRLEVVTGERLLQGIDTLVQPSGIDDGIARVARHVEDRQVGPGALYTSRQIVALPRACKHDVGEKQIDAFLALFEGNGGFVGRPTLQPAAPSTRSIRLRKEDSSSTTTTNSLPKLGTRS